MSSGLSRNTCVSKWRKTERNSKIKPWELSPKMDNIIPLSNRSIKFSNLSNDIKIPYFWCRGSSETGTAVVYKSNERKRLEESGYRIIGNIGDQWSDILGTNTGTRTFKLPDPMYYISWCNFDLEFHISIN